MADQKFPWVVICVGDGYAAARNGKNGTPEVGFHYYLDPDDAQEECDWANEADGITDAPRFDD